MEKHKFKVLIAGGSIAGLVLANILEQLGVDFLVLEAYPEIAPQVGASIGFFPNGCRILDQIGCFDDVRARLHIGMTELYFNSPEGKTLGQVIEHAADHFITRYGYDPIFVDRQMAIEVFYDHLRDKSKVLVGKRVENVKPLANGVQVTTKDGSTYTGDILVGADGIHSTVREEMWRLADELSPGYFAATERKSIPCDYTCMYGISHSVPGFSKSSSQPCLGYNHSYLVVDGPGGRIYWFLFIKNEKTLYGIEDEIPRRFTKEQEEAVAQKYWEDRISGDIKFGDLYKNKMTAILTSLPEFVFTKWHYGRIITIGDASHKFNPISGQGGNSAIESAAALATELINMLKSLPQNGIPTDADISGVFQRAQDTRYDRVAKLVANGHMQQRVMAMETRMLEFLARHIIPRSGLEGTFENFASSSLGGTRLPMLPMPKRPRFEPYHDELPAKPLGGSKLSWGSMGVAAAVFAGLTAAAKTAVPGDAANGLLTQPAALPTLLAPSLLIWTVEGYRNANAQTLVALPSLFTLATHIHGGKYAALAFPLYFLLSTWTTSRAAYTRAVGRPVPTPAAKAVLPATLLGAAIPAALLHTSIPTAALAVIPPLATAAVTYANKRLGDARNPPTPFSVYTKEDVGPLRRAFAAASLVCAAVHLSSTASAPSSSSSPLSLPSLFQHGGIAAVSVAAWCLHSVWELRRAGWATTKEAVAAAAAVVAGQGVVGPGAVWAGLWAWREGVWGREARLEGRGEE